MTILENLKKSNFLLPEFTKPVANYEACAKVGNLLYISGQLPKNDKNEFITGKCGLDISNDDAKLAARSCILYTISTLNHYLKNNGKTLDDIKRIVKIVVLINSTADFVKHSQIANGASDTLIEVFQDKGKHSRSALGVSSLPCGAVVEIESIIEI